MDLVPQGVEFGDPIGLELLVQELLGPCPILDPEKLVLAPLVLQVFPVHLARQPLASVEADLDLEGEPGLQAHVQPAELGVEVVVIQLRALATLAAHLPETLRVLPPLKGPARLDTLQHAHESFSDVMLRGQVPGDWLFGDLAGIEVAKALPLARPAHQRGGQQPARDSGRVRLEIRALDPIEREQGVHALRAI